MSEELKSTPTLPRVLLVEDRLSLARCYSEFLSAEKCEIIHVDTGEKAMHEIVTMQPALMLLDMQLPDMDSMEILRHIQQENLPIAVVVITAHGSFELSRTVMELGAHDYLEKPFTRDRLCVTVRNGIKQLQLQTAVGAYQHGFCDFIGSSMIMQSVYRIIESAAASRASVFITGESGTGKEVCAEAIHRLSNRSEQECVTINCAAIPHNLMESEIFGHVKGAFTGAVGQREGAAARANGGTLFLDEIGEMDMELQSKLLRFIQTGQFQKVGSNVTETVDVRFICATNRDPLEEVRKGNFREDLYYRLHVVPIHLPPLRERGQDVVDIAKKFLVQYAREDNKSFRSFSRETEQIFRNYAWPGNVRQLLNVVRNVVVLQDGEEVAPAMLPPPLNTAMSSAAQQTVHKPESGSVENSVNLDSIVPGKAMTIDDIKPLWLVEYETIETAIELCDGSITRAAKLLEVSPSTIYRKRPGWDKDKIAALAQYQNR